MSSAVAPGARRASRSAARRRAACPSRATAAALRARRYALVPRSLAGPGSAGPRGRARRSSRRPRSWSARRGEADARRLLAFLRTERRLASCWPRCLDPRRPVSSSSIGGRGSLRHRRRGLVAARLLPRRATATTTRTTCSAPPTPSNLGGRDNYRGFMSLGQGGYVTVDMGGGGHQRAGRRRPRLPGHDRASRSRSTRRPAAPAPSSCIGLREPCGHRSAGHLLELLRLRPGRRAARRGALPQDRGRRDLPLPGRRHAHRGRGHRRRRRS